MYAHTCTCTCICWAPCVDLSDASRLPLCDPTQQFGCCSNKQINSQFSPMTNLMCFLRGKRPCEVGPPVWPSGPPVARAGPGRARQRRGPKRVAPQKPGGVTNNLKYIKYMKYVVLPPDPRTQPPCLPSTCISPTAVCSPW